MDLGVRDGVAVVSVANARASHAAVTRPGSGHGLQIATALAESVGARLSSAVTPTEWRVSLLLRLAPVTTKETIQRRPGPSNSSPENAISNPVVRTNPTSRTATTSAEPTATR